MKSYCGRAALNSVSMTINHITESSAKVWRLSTGSLVAAPLTNSLAGWQVEFFQRSTSNAQRPTSKFRKVRLSRSLLPAESSRDTLTTGARPKERFVGQIFSGQALRIPDHSHSRRSDGAGPMALAPASPAADAHRRKTHRH